VKQLYAPQAGGDPDFWRLRPLNELALQYAAMDVHLLLKLYHTLDERLSPQSRVSILGLSKRRIEEFRDSAQPVMNRRPEHSLAPVELSSRRSAPKPKKDHTNAPRGAEQREPTPE